MIAADDPYKEMIIEVMQPLVQKWLFSQGAANYICRALIERYYSGGTQKIVLPNLPTKVPPINSNWSPDNQVREARGIKKDDGMPELPSTVFPDIPADSSSGMRNVGAPLIRERVSPDEFPIIKLYHFGLIRRTDGNVYGEEGTCKESGQVEWEKFRNRGVAQDNDPNMSRGTGLPLPDMKAYNEAFATFADASAGDARFGPFSFNMSPVETAHGFILGHHDYPEDQAFRLTLASITERGKAAAGHTIVSKQSPGSVTTSADRPAAIIKTLDSFKGGNFGKEQANEACKRLHQAVFGSNMLQNLPPPPDNPHTVRADRAQEILLYKFYLKSLTTSPDNPEVTYLDGSCQTENDQIKYVPRRNPPQNLEKAADRKAVYKAFTELANATRHSKKYGGQVEFKPYSIKLEQFGRWFHGFIMFCEGQWVLVAAAL